jgi:hypothetical protein
MSSNPAPDPATPAPTATGTPVAIAKAKGRPMLTWVGKRPLTQLTAFPAQHIETYQAMFDEVDEATAITKCTNTPPVGASTFLTYEGLPSDHYLWLVGQGARLIRGDLPLRETMPERR